MDNGKESLEETVSEQQQRIDKLEQTVQKMMPSRRDTLKAGAAAGVGMLGFGAGTASADLNDGDTQWGSDSNRDDYIVDHLDANVVDTDEAAIGRQHDNKVVDVSASPYNAPEIGNGDGTTAVQQAVDDVKAAGGGKILFPYRVKVTSTIDATNTYNIAFESTRPLQRISTSSTGGEPGLYGETSGSPVLDMTGTEGYRIACGIHTAWAGGSNHANVGVLTARSSAQDTARGGSFDNATISGAFTVAGVYNISKEIGAMRDSEITTSGCPALIADGDNQEGVTSPYATINTVLSTTKWTYEGVQFKSYSASECIKFGRATSEHTFDNPYFVVNTLDACAVKFDMTNAAINGDFVFEAARLETPGSTDPAHFVKMAGSTSSTMSGLTIRGGYFKPLNGGNLVDAPNYTFANFTFEGGHRNTFDTANTTAIDVFALEDSEIRTTAPYLTVSLADHISRSSIELLHNSCSYSAPATTYNGVEVYTYASGKHKHRSGMADVRPVFDSAPSNPEVGMEVYASSSWDPDGDTNGEKVVYDGTAWVEIVDLPNL